MVKADIVREAKNQIEIIKKISPFSTRGKERNKATFLFLKTDGQGQATEGSGREGHTMSSNLIRLRIRL